MTAIVVGLLLLIQQHLRKKLEWAQLARGVQNEAADKKAQFKLEAENFELSLREKWPVRHVSEGYLQRLYLMISADQRQIGLVQINLRTSFEVAWADPIDVASVVSVELQQESETIMKLESTAITKKTGSLGRAAIGGALFGGAGAIVGATSAGSKTAISTASTSHTEKGPVYLVIGTTDMIKPVLKTQMKSKDEGEQWLHRIRGALALIA